MSPITGIMKGIITEKTILAEEVAVPKSSVESENTSSISMQLDRKTERRLVWKCDRHVLPMISLLYLLAFVDRVNIGNARIQGLEEDLNMDGNDFNVALFIFFIPYILLEVPSNLILKKIAPSTWLSSIMFCWGIYDLDAVVTKPVLIMIQVLSQSEWASPRTMLDWWCAGSFSASLRLASSLVVPIAYPRSPLC